MPQLSGLFDPTEFKLLRLNVFKVPPVLLVSVLDAERDVKELVDFNRVIYLGAGPFFGLAHEAQLKILELTAGQAATMYESPVGFRHDLQNWLTTKNKAVSLPTTTDYTVSRFCSWSCRCFVALKFFE